MPRLLEIRSKLLEAIREESCGPSSPSGGEDRTSSQPFEAIVKAALTLIAEPKRASRAYEVLRGAGLLDPEILGSVAPLELEEIFRTAKVRIPSKSLLPLQRIARWAVEQDLERLSNWSTDEIREEWLGLRGVGLATADSILLFGLGRSTYPVDRATYRILIRHGWLDSTADYDEARTVVEDISPDDPESLTLLSVGFEKIGREYCKTNDPRCDRCPLRPFLPEGRPVDLSGA